MAQGVEPRRSRDRVEEVDRPRPAAGPAGDGQATTTEERRDEVIVLDEPGADSVTVLDDAEGRQYRDGVFRRVDLRGLGKAPPRGDFPDPGRGEPFHRLDEVPRVPKLRHIIGPSFVALGIGLGAGEFLLWPNLIAVNGPTILWLFVIGVLAQFVVIAEIQRWTVATGESLFAGMARMTRGAFWPWFFVAASLISFFWPGWASQSATFVQDSINLVVGREVVTAWQPIAIGMLAFAWLALALSKVVYNVLERFEIFLVAAFFPLLIVAAVLAGIALTDAASIGQGLVGLNGTAPPELVSGDQFPTLLIAVAYAGSGGTLLLGQTLWVRDKGFGLAAYQGRIAGIRGENEQIIEPGYAFSTRVRMALRRFQRWMRLVHVELLVAFVIPIIVSVVLTGLVVAATIGFDNQDMAGDLTGMVTAQAEALRQSVGAWLALVFLLGGALVLFSTQFGIMDTITRISGDIIYSRLSAKGRRFSIKGVFLTFLTVLTLASIAIVVLSWLQGRGIEEKGNTLQPNFLIIIAGPFTIASMYAFACVIAILNTRYLPPTMRMSRTKLVSMYLAILLWGWFTAETIARTWLKYVSGTTGEEASNITWDPVRATFYGLMLATLGFVVARTFAPGFLDRRRAPTPAREVTAPARRS